MRKNILILIILLAIGFFFFTFKILSIPPGLETDEASIAYNSALISQNLRDQNERFLPIFILSSDKIDWKQPVLIYFIAFLFKIFGKSLIVYKLANIIISLLTAVTLYFIAKILFKDQKYAVASFLIYITTPIIFITTRIGNESILPSLISALWLLTLILYKNNQKYLYLAFNAFIIGIGFYTFKGMRIVVPVWSVISFLYIYCVSWNKNNTTVNNILNRHTFKRLVFFSLIVLPFFLITPILEIKYAGAVFDRQSVSISSVYNFFYYWLSNISFYFWFTIPDIGRVYTVSEFGANFLFFLPFFILGIINSIKRKTYFRFILICFIFTPFLFGIAHSVNYPHRLTANIPFIVILILYGIKTALNYFNNRPTAKIIKLICLFLLVINLYSFYSFYFLEYPKLNITSEAFGKYTYSSFKNLSDLSKQYNLTPLVEERIYSSEGDENKFYNLAYFKNQLQVWKLGEPIYNQSVLLTYNDQIDGLEIYNLNLPNNLHLLIKK